jgi:hypothetical protein
VTANYSMAVLCICNAISHILDRFYKILGSKAGRYSLYFRIPYFDKGFIFYSYSFQANSYFISSKLRTLHAVYGLYQHRLK